MRVIHKAFKFRLYPSNEQVSILRQWQGAMRFLWNIALEQRLLQLQRVKYKRQYPTFYDQRAGCRELRAELPWLDAVPFGVLDEMLQSLDKAWQAWTKKLHDLPRFKHRGDPIGIHCASASHWDLVKIVTPLAHAPHANATLKFPKMPGLALTQHRELEGIRKRCIISRDVDQWYVSMLCEISREDLDESPKHSVPLVGMNRGVRDFLSDSDGQRIMGPHFEQVMERQILRAHRSLSKKKRGSKNAEKARIKLARLQRRLRFMRTDWLHKISHHYARNYRAIAIEDLNIIEMTRSAKGRSEEVDKPVEVVAKFNRAILHAAWGQFAQQLDYKTQWANGTLIRVSPEYISQDCAKCHERTEHPIGAPVFTCAHCGYTVDSGTNASNNVLQRALKNHGPRKKATKVTLTKVARKKSPPALPDAQASGPSLSEPARIESEQVAVTETVSSSVKEE